MRLNITEGYMPLDMLANTFLDESEYCVRAKEVLSESVERS